MPTCYENPMEQLDKTTFDNLKTEALAVRMDQILLNARQEIGGFSDVKFREILASPVLTPRIQDIVETEKYKNADDKEKRRLLDVSFRYLMQMSLWDSSFQISNQIEEHAEWDSPFFQLKACSLYQYQIISARIVLECFFDLIAVANDGNRLKGKTKFGAFKKWMLTKDSPYRQFIPMIVAGFRFSRQFRDPEVHGTSMFKEPLLRLSLPSRELGYARVDLTNALRTAWRPFLAIMNGKELEGLWTPVDLDFSQHYFDNAHPDFDNYLKAFFKREMS